MEESSIDLAINNIVNFGDTDIFPYPIETRIFQDNKAETIELVKNIDLNFEKYLRECPPVNISTCIPAGYTGFRWATQLDPIWNLYFLSLVIEIAQRIEDKRILKTESTVFSYRFLPNFQEGFLFDKDVTWRTFQEQSIKIAKSAAVSYVVVCDISDFYTRIYHHRLENELDRIDEKISQKIKALIKNFSGGTSYGLPIGGPASRILAELLLDATDKILKSKSIKFVRFVDDYHIFCSSLENAHSVLLFLTQKLMKNEGLTLQKNKTLISSKEEFISVAESRLIASDDEDSAEKAKFMSLSVTYDPYSPTARDDYERIKKELKDFDLLGMLHSELRKSKINQPFGKHLLKAFNLTSEEVLSEAFILIMDKLNLLYPIFSTIMMVASTNWERMSLDCKERLTQKFSELVRGDSYIIKSELHAAFLCKLIAKDHSSENIDLLTTIYDRHISSILVTSLIMQIMAKWNICFWISDLRSNFQTMNRWQRRTFIIASYILDDEGEHWRGGMKHQFSFFEMFYRNWAAMRKQSNNLGAAL